MWVEAWAKNSGGASKKIYLAVQHRMTWAPSSRLPVSHTILEILRSDMEGKKE